METMTAIHGSRRLERTVLGLSTIATTQNPMLIQVYRRKTVPARRTITATAKPIAKTSNAGSLLVINAMLNAIRMVMGTTKRAAEVMIVMIPVSVGNLKNIPKALVRTLKVIATTFATRIVMVSQAALIQTVSSIATLLRLLHHLRVQRLAVAAKVVPVAIVFTAVAAATVEIA